LYFLYKQKTISYHFTRNKIMGAANYMIHYEIYRVFRIKTWWLFLARVTT